MLHLTIHFIGFIDFIKHEIGGSKKFSQKRSGQLSQQQCKADKGTGLKGTILNCEMAPVKGQWISQLQTNRKAPSSGGQKF